MEDRHEALSYAALALRRCLCPPSSSIAIVRGGMGACGALLPCHHAKSKEEGASRRDLTHPRRYGSRVPRRNQASEVSFYKPRSRVLQRPNHSYQIRQNGP
jgi:hypothetical protein